MKEDLLHYIWKMKRFDWKALRTTAGEVVEILHFGIHNHDAGPDFLEGKVKIGDTIWAGNIELHTKSSDWYHHKHQDDPKYDNIILHVVYTDDRPVMDSQNNVVPTIVLESRIDPAIIDSYDNLINNQHWIPCEKSIAQVKKITKAVWLDRLMIERLERKTTAIQELLNRTNNDWEEAFYRGLSRNLGLKVNGTSFEMLAASIDLKTIIKYKHNALQIEALLFGQAGMLDKDFEDEYPSRLKKEYQLLQHKHQLKPIDPNLWKFMRLRPANFPTIRIAQLAQLLYQSNHLFSKMLAAGSVKEIENMFEVKLANYWKDHYQFDKESTSRAKKLGKSTVHLLLINTIVPFLFHYGKHRKEEKYVDKALDLLRACKPENNSIIKNWKALGVDADSAHTSQALLQLKNEYCSAKRCMSCAVGTSIMKA